MPDASQPISVKKTNEMSAGCARVFLLVFFVFGAGFLYPTVLQPLWNVWHARTWVQVPCRILSSDVKPSSGGRGRTYYVAIRYAYRFEGQNYESDRCHFFLANTSGYSGKKKIADRYPPGSEANCFVDPEAPGEAVLQRGPTLALCWGLIPMPFVLIGLIAFVPARVLAKFDTKATPLKTTLSGNSSPVLASNRDATVGGSVELRATTSRRGKLIGLIFAAVVWNGIVSFLVRHAWKSIEAGRPDWFEIIFMIPFVLAGIAFLGGVVHAFLNLFNPSLTLQVSSSAIPLGGTLDAQWSFRGNTRRLRDLKIVLEGAERATYRRGTNTSTDEHVFAKLPLVETSDPASIGAGSGRITIPADLMHSFKAKNNEITWKLKVRSEIPWFPDVSEEYPLTVLPRPLVQS